MTTFECNQLNDSTVMMVYLEREHILMNPPYQRDGEVWTLYKKQLLIDSLINGFDIPKLYFHEYEKAKRHNGKLIKYAIVDGKQRLSAIWQFMEQDGFRLSSDIQYLRDSTVRLQGLTYEDLRRDPTTRSSHRRNSAHHTSTPLVLQRPWSTVNRYTVSD